MQSKVSKWGHSLAVRLPKAVVAQLGFKQDGAVSLEIRDGQLLIRPVGEEKVYSLDELVAGITSENCHAEVDWGHALGAEFS